MINTKCCAFCGKELNDVNKTEINGEHIFPAFACNKTFGNSEASRLLQEKIKVSVCKECNTRYGKDLETRLSKIIDGLNGKIPRYAFRTEEALCLLDYIDKTRVLLQHYMSPNKQQHAYVANASQILPFGRQVFILHADTPDGVYFKSFSTENTKLLKAKFDDASSEYPITNMSSIAVCIDNTVIIGMSYWFINHALGFPFGVRTFDNPDAIQLQEGKHKINIDCLWEISNKAESCTGRNFKKNLIMLAQPGTLPVSISEAEKFGIIGEYEKSHQLTTMHNDYVYAVYFESGEHKGWLSKNAMERGAKGVKFDLSAMYSYEDFLVLFDQASKLGLLEFMIDSGFIKDPDELCAIDKEIRQAHWYRTNIISNPFVANKVEYLAKKYGYDKARERINALNLSFGEDFLDITSYLYGPERK